MLSFLSSISLLPLLLNACFSLAQSVTDPYDLTFLKKGAAVGDSYASGLGAGQRLDQACSRYDGSYPNMVATQLGFGQRLFGFDFKFLACSGKTIPKIVDEQLSQLSGGQDFILISAGGNDVAFEKIVNGCVFGWSGIFRPNCDKSLEDTSNTIRSLAFASSLDSLLASAKSKLADGGNIYYVGYAKFWNTSDRGCDTVHWSIWKVFAREYFTLERRSAMNNVVDLMNSAIRDAVSRAGSQVHFVDYDRYVGDTNGTFCQPGADERGGRSANRENLFFYEMESSDSPWSSYTQGSSDTALSRRVNGENDDDNDAPANDTLGALYGDSILEMLQNMNSLAQLEDDNVNNELVVEVQSAEGGPSKRSFHQIETHHHSLPPYLRHWSVRSYNGTRDGEPSTTVTTKNGSVIQTNSGVQVSSNSTSGNSTTHSGTGVVVSNGTHVILSNGQPVPKAAVKKLFVGDRTARALHPTQAGHALIANLILYQMAAQRAAQLGIADNFPPQDVLLGDDDWPQLPDAACNTDSSNTWADRDATISAVKSFCADTNNVIGVEGQCNAANFNKGGFDYLSISVNWNTNGTIGQHNCEALLGVVTDGCDVPGDGKNVDNMKHGGLIAYDTEDMNATLSITPLVMRKIWDKGQAGGQSCNPMDSNNYVQHDTLERNIKDYCQQSAAQAGGIANSGQTFQQTFSANTPDEVVLSTEWPQGARNYQIWAAECEYYMGVLNNDCSIGGPANPMNLKHGGTMSDNNGVKYTITPTRTRPPPPSKPQGECSVTWFIFGYAWSVSGGGFASSDYGAELLKQMQGCGVVANWGFDYDQKGRYEWTAHGTLPLLISSHCVGAAIASAGGFQSDC